MRIIDIQRLQHDTFILYHISYNNSYVQLGGFNAVNRHKENMHKRN